MIYIGWARLPPCQWPKVGLRTAKWPIEKSLNKLYILFQYFYCGFLTRKQISVVALAVVFQGRCPRAIIMQPIRKLQWTDTKASSGNLIISFMETTRCSEDWPKTYSLLVYDFCIVVSIFKVAASLSILSTIRLSLAQQKKQMKTINFDNTYDIHLIICFGNYIYANRDYYQSYMFFFCFCFWLLI